MANAGVEANGIHRKEYHHKKCEDPPTDPLIDIIGQVGRWQLILFTVTGFSIVIHAWAMLANKWIAYPVNYWCEKPEYLMELEPKSWIGIYAPYIEGHEPTERPIEIMDDSEPPKIEEQKDIKIMFDRCRIFEMDYYVGRPNHSDVIARKCRIFEFDSTQYANTITERFDLTCEYDNYPKMGQSIFFAGTFFGVFASGYLSDRFGRIMAYRASLFLWVIFGIAGAFAPDFWTWSLFRFICGGASIAFNTCQSVYCVELAGYRWRSYTNSFFRALPFAVGHVTLGLLVYIIPDMVHLEVVIGCSGIPFLIFSFFIPESPRWLLVNGRYDEARKIIEKACKFNGTVPKEEELEALKTIENERSDSGKMWLLFKYPGIRRNMIIMNYCWICFSMAYFGLIYNTPTFDLDPIVVFVIPAVLDFPVVLAYPFMENSFGRKPMLTGSLLVAGFFLLMTVTVPAGWPVIILSTIGLKAAGTAFDGGYCFTRELAPTFLRGSALSLASASARLGSVLSPLVASIHMGSTLDVILPVIIYGILTMAAAIASVWLWPETLKTRLPNTLEEAESQAKTRNRWTYC
eukprot:maker-scaffold343_size201629-snap-gene-1.17 protein:Tk08444 transcript:maker-scaffold343_size201629-snap-gene-1.17-mRNA-1 annotation:"unknown"